MTGEVRLSKMHEVPACGGERDSLTVIREQPERCSNGEGRGDYRLIVMGGHNSDESGRQGRLPERSGNPGRPGVRMS